ncbi:MAG: radical SAM family heme chaperone HemW [Candidatus Gracilibacteria bacterium]|nr:radical SAM family heme chaperone HemW [Candidatus Gracilibacteria bacterium]
MFFYLHIPFCRQKCRYCKFALTPKFDELKVRTYIDALKREIGDFFSTHPEVSIKTVYFGGGTPSVLTGEQIAEILDVFRRQKGFADISEITLESNPEDISSEYLDALSRLGINRLSLGVQTLNNESLRMVGRADSNGSIFQALDAIAEGPIGNVSIDLIAGLPGTAPEQIVSDLTEIFSRATPKHVSIYMLEDESYPASWKPHLPDEGTIRSEYRSGMEWLQSRGFYRYELSNFALPGFESKHNQSYWNHSDYQGFGLSSASFVGGERFANSSSFMGYYRGEKQTDGILSSESRNIERIMFGFRTSGVSLDELQNRSMVEKFREEGLLEVRENKVFPTSTGIFLIDYIIGELI